MALLKKLRGSSLLETLTASVIIVVVFMIASFSFNNVFMNSVKANDDLLQNRLQELEYLSGHDKISFPFFEEGPYWIISAEEFRETAKFEVRNMRSGKEYIKTIENN